MGDIQYVMRRPHLGSGHSSRNPPSSAPKTTKTAVKSQPIKKKKKPLADRLVYLTGIPVDATEQEVTDLVGSFGKINNVILLPCSEEESEKGQGQKASVCMMTAEDAQALASASKLCIRDKEITASVAKEPNEEPLSDANSKTDAEKDKESAENTSGGETEQKNSDQKWKVLITGLPDSGWSESDIFQLVESFGTPSDIIMAMQIGKALVSFSTLEVAEELVKVHSFKPAMFKDTEVKMRLVKQPIGFRTPVALYNLFTGSLDPLEGPPPVGWNSLVVIKNVPDTSTASTDVLKLMRRFGTVIKSLVVNSMIICEMATTTMALSVYKRFLMFPCVIQNNRLIFYRKPDPRAHSQTKIIPAYCEASEEKPEDNSQAAAEPSEQDDVPHQDDSEVQLAEDGNEQAKTEEQTEEENLTDKESKEDGVKEEQQQPSVSVSSPPSDAKPDKDLAEAENADVDKDVTPSELEKVEEKQAPSSNNDESATAELAMPELPKMTQAMVNALLVECRTRTASNLNKTEAPPAADQGQAKREEVEDENKEKTTDCTKDLTKNAAREKGKVLNRQERRRLERAEKKEEARKEWERRNREAKERKERERRERERRERRRDHDERSSWSRSSHGSGGYRHSWRDEQHRGEAERRKQEQPEEEEEEEHFDEFPFNLSDFVTVDELGDVTDLPDPALCMDTSEEGDAAPQTEPREEHKDASVETTATQKEESDEKVSESEHLDMATPQNFDSMESGLDLNAAEPPPADSLIHIPSECQPEESKDDKESEPETKEEGMRSSPVDDGEAQDEPRTEASNKQAEQPDEENNDKAPETSDAHSGPAEELTVVPKTDEDTPDIKEESVENPLPPYDPNKAVGLEYLLPKTGFFCKVCSRFFTGAKAAEISHCKTLKHYENLQKFLQNPESSRAAGKTASS